ncbi:MAG: SDR family oxidoreductase [Candidatus Hydrogenedentota bacterium]|nr:MAG: SDR family oxidoreductase [Candidatus Hydrogenedentota bacterium]
MAKVVLITGSNSGIGKALAQTYYQQGWRVGCVARSKEKLENTITEIKENFPRSSGELLPLIADVSDWKASKKAVDKLLKEWGELHVVICNAGISMRANAADTSLDVFHKLMDVNFFGVVHFFKACIDELRKTRGSFVAISSMQGLFSTQLRSGYAAAKHAVQGFMDSVRIEEKNVHVLTVSPGFVKTNVAVNALLADGTQKGSSDKAIESGLDPNVVAKKIAVAIRKRKRDLYPAGFKEKFALFLSKVSPKLLDKILRSVSVT